MPTVWTLLATVCGSALLGSIATLALLHQKQVLAWMKAIRRKDDDNAVLEAPAKDLADLFEEQCGRAHTPSSSEDFARLIQIKNMIKGRTPSTPAVRAELAAVVQSAEKYVETALPPLGPNTKVSLSECTALQERAMKQESARIQLEQDILVAQQAIITSRRS